MVTIRTMPDEAANFLSVLAPDGELTFQTFSDKKTSRSASLSRIFHGEFDKYRRLLEAVNANGAGCFVMVNRGDGTGRKTTNVTAVRAVFVDLDGAPLAPVLAAPIPPSIVCESSLGRHHAYWPIRGMPLADFKRAQGEIATLFGGDPKVCDLPRVMRLPGFIHGKGEPHLSKLLSCAPAKPWEWFEFAEVMGLSNYGNAAEISEFFEAGERNNKLYVFACGLVRQGFLEGDVFARVRKANDSKCRPALPLEEVETIVRSALKRPIEGFVQLPYQIIDSDGYRRLPDIAKTALTGLLRKSNGNNNGRITFTRSEAESFGLSRKQRTKALAACESAGLIECTAKGKPAYVGHRASPDMFRVIHLKG